MLFASLAALSCLTTLTLPETSDIKLIDSIEEAEAFYEKSSSKLVVIGLGLEKIYKNFTENTTTFKASNK